MSRLGGPPLSGRHSQSRPPGRGTGAPPPAGPEDRWPRGRTAARARAPQPPEQEKPRLLRAPRRLPAHGRTSTRARTHTRTHTRAHTHTTKGSVGGPRAEVWSRSYGKPLPAAPTALPGPSRTAAPAKRPVGARILQPAALAGGEAALGRTRAPLRPPTSRALAPSRPSGCRVGPGLQKPREPEDSLLPRLLKK